MGPPGLFQDLPKWFSTDPGKASNTRCATPSGSCLKAKEPHLPRKGRPQDLDMTSMEVLAVLCQREFSHRLLRRNPEEFPLLIGYIFILTYE
jgi:hypothetical protein